MDKYRAILQEAANIVSDVFTADLSITYEMETFEPKVTIAQRGAIAMQQPTQSGTIGVVIESPTFRVSTDDFMKIVIGLAQSTGFTASPNESLVFGVDSTFGDDSSLNDLEGSTITLSATRYVQEAVGCRI